MKIVFYTSGTAGSGRFVRGISLGNALKRIGFEGEYVILSSSSFGHLADQFGMKHVEIQAENEDALSAECYRSSALYKTLKELKPDVLVVDLLWFSLYHIIDHLKCRKIFISHQVIPEFFSIDFPSVKMEFNPDQYDILIGIEPFESEYSFTFIDPLVIRSREEIMSRKDALSSLGIKKKGKLILFAINARPDDFDHFKEKYSHLENSSDAVIYSTNYRGGLFPVVDYYNAFDTVISLAGYNQFWESKYFGVESIFETIPLNFSSMKKRIDDCGSCQLRKNGADELAGIAVSL